MHGKQYLVVGKIGNHMLDAFHGGNMFLREGLKREADRG